LTHLEIAGFRAIDHLSLAIDDVTVLIGEHNSSNSTVLDAIDACLGLNTRDPTADFDEGDFCREPTRSGSVPPIRITLTVQESVPGEWGTGPLAGFGSSNGSDHRRIRCRVEGRQNGSDEIVRTIAIDGATPDRSREAWGAIRTSMPVMHLRADRFARLGNGDEGVCEITPGSTPVARTFQTLCRTHGRMSARALADAIHEAEAELEGIPEYLLRENDTGRRSLATIDRPRSALSRLIGGVGSFRPGTGAQAAGVFLLLAMILDARGMRAIPKGSWPIVLIEEPEAHMHPIVTSTIWGVLEGLRAQIIASTYSPEIVASTPLRSVRRMIRRARSIEVRSIADRDLAPDEVRRLSYHVRVRRGGSMFARAWLLVEGETEGWLMPELAILCGYSLPTEGIECIEFAQSGIEPLIKTADALGIEWHLIADGDSSGRGYAHTTRSMLNGRPERDHLTLLRARDIEEFLFNAGYAHVYRGAAGLTGHSAERPERARAVINKAIKATSKPQMALRVVEAMAMQGSPGVPPMLREMIDGVVALARKSVAEST